MRYGLFLFLMVCATVVAWINWLLVLFNVNPEQTGWLGHSVFYISLFIALSGTIFLCSNAVHTRLMKQHIIAHRVRNSLRHAIFFTTLVVGWAMMKSLGLLRWWNILLLIVVLTVLEFFFISFEKQRVSTDAEL